MGLFVVGRLSDRHGIRVQLRPSGEQAGTTSLVMLPDAITHARWRRSPAARRLRVHRLDDDPGAAGVRARAADARRPSWASTTAVTRSRTTPCELDPVGRSSLMREERRAALERSADPERSRPGDRPLFRDQVDASSSRCRPARPSPSRPRTTLSRAATINGQRSGYDDRRQGVSRRAASRSRTASGSGPPTTPSPPAQPRLRQWRSRFVRPELRGAGRPCVSRAGVPYNAFGSPRGRPTGRARTPTRATSRLTCGYARSGIRPGALTRRSGERRLRPAPSGGPGLSAGPSPSAPHALTDAGLPRRGGGAPQRQEPAPELPSRTTTPGARPTTSVGACRAARGAEGRRSDSSGLPRRVRKANLVEGTAESTPQGGPQISRAPEDVRGRLSNLRRGVQRGRSEGSSDQ